MSCNAGLCTGIGQYLKLKPNLLTSRVIRSNAVRFIAVLSFDFLRQTKIAATLQTTTSQILIMAKPQTKIWHMMMTSSIGNILRVTGHLCGEFNGQYTKASNVELWCSVNNHEAGDLRRHRAHYDVTIIWWRHDTKAFSVSNAGFDVFFDTRLSKRF